MAEARISLDDKDLVYTGCGVYRAKRIRKDDAVKRQGKILSLTAAIEERTAGRDIVVCGADARTNLTITQTIEAKATGNCHQRHAVHANLGSCALPHFQHRVRQSLGHTFYESPPDRMAIDGGNP